MLSRKVGLCNTGRLMKTLVAWWMINESLNPLGFEEHCGQFSDEGCSGKCWVHKGSSSREIVTDIFSSSLLTKWPYRLSYTFWGVSILDVLCSWTNVWNTNLPTPLLEPKIFLGRCWAPSKYQPGFHILPWKDSLRQIQATNPFIRLLY